MKQLLFATILLLSGCSSRPVNKRLNANIERVISLNIHNHINSPLDQQKTSAVVNEENHILAAAAYVNNQPIISLRINWIKDEPFSTTSCNILKSVLANPEPSIDTVDVHIFDSITCCSGPDTNFVGCSGTVLPTAVLAPQNTPTLRAVQWLHELGHNRGLKHRNENGALMYETPTSGFRKLDDCEYQGFLSANPGVDCRNKSGGSLLQAR